MRMPGNKAYQRLLQFVCPGYNLPEVDIDWRTVGLLGIHEEGIARTHVFPR